MLVRFDPGTADTYALSEIRDEMEPNQNLQVRRRTALQRQARQLETGSQALVQSDFRAALTAARINLADAVATLPRPDGLSRVLDLQPYRSTRRINSYRKADELTIQLNWREVPFDSRIVRAILLFHYEGTVSADEWGDGIEESPVDPTGRSSLVKATGNNLRFVGLADIIGDEHGEGDRISIKARDLTAVLLDTNVPPKTEVRIQPGDTIATVVRRILDTNDAFEIIRGPFLRTEGPLPALDANLYHRLAVPPKERHRQDQTGGRPYALRYLPKQGELKYWDLITELCVTHSLRPVIEQDKLILLEPRTLYKTTPVDVTQSGVPTFPTTYRRRIGDTSTVRRMVYGLNLHNLQFNRKLGGVRAPAVEIVARNPDAKEAKNRLIKVRYPAKPRANHVDPSGKKPMEKVHRVDVRGVVDESVLFATAKQAYEGLGRQEMGIVFTTSDLASHSDHPRFDPNEDPDLLDLKAGDPIRILVTPTARRTGLLFSLSELNRMITRNARTASPNVAADLSNTVEFLVSRGWRVGDAEQLTRLLTSSQLPSEFRVVSASVSYDGEGDGGMSISVDARDYVRVRADPEDFSVTGGARQVEVGSLVAPRSFNGT